MKKYYSLETAGKDADLYIFGDITTWPWDEKDKDAYGIVKELKELEADCINVHINSYGGDVSEGLAIYNVLKNSASKITTYCDGFACSAASVIFMAGEERVMNSASLLMIHNAWSWASGNANDFRKQAEDLDKITQASVNAYMNRVSITMEEVKKMMDEETWITADEAVEKGFATKIMDEKKEGINQSSMMSIRKRILGTESSSVLTELKTAEGRIPDGIEERIAERVAREIKELFGKNKTSKDSTGFGAFFNSGKGE